MSLNINGFLINKILSNQEIMQVFDIFGFTDVKKDKSKSSLEDILADKAEKIGVTKKQNATFFSMRIIEKDVLYFFEISRLFPECELFYFNILDSTCDISLCIYQNAKIIRQLEYFDGEYKSKFKPIIEESKFLGENYKKLTKAQVFEIYENEEDGVAMSDVGFEFFTRYFGSDFDILSDDFFFVKNFDTFTYKNPRYFSRADFDSSPEFFQQFLDAIGFR